MSHSLVFAYYQTLEAEFASPTAPSIGQDKVLWPWPDPIVEGPTESEPLKLSLRGKRRGRGRQEVPKPETKTPIPLPPAPPLCACGCGQPVKRQTTGWSRWKVGHQLRGQPLPKPLTQSVDSS